MVQKIDRNQITMSNGYGTTIFLDACFFLINSNVFVQSSNNSVLNEMHIAFFWFKKKYMFIILHKK